MDDSELRLPTNPEPFHSQKSQSRSAFHEPINFKIKTGALLAIFRLPTGRSIVISHAFLYFHRPKWPHSHLGHVSGQKWPLSSWVFFPLFPLYRPKMTPFSWLILPLFTGQKWPLSSWVVFPFFSLYLSDMTPQFMRNFTSLNWPKITPFSWVFFTSLFSLLVKNDSSVTIHFHRPK